LPSSWYSHSESRRGFEAKEGRRIFQRMTNYAAYRMAET
jgi:hypothetical protein